MPKVKVKVPDKKVVSTPTAASDDSVQRSKDASEKVILNNLLNKKMPIDDKTALEVLKRVSMNTGIDMPFLAANAFEEGMGDVIRKGDMSKDDFILNSGGNETHPISGYRYYGLDTFGNRANEMKKKKYISDNFDYETFGIRNEKEEDVTSANFRNNEDALTAKAAYLKLIKDDVQDYSSKKNIKLEPLTEKYLIMSGYNGGMGNARIMMDELATGKFNQKDYVTKGQTSRQGIHKNIVPRLRKMEMIDKLTTGPVAPFKGKTIADKYSFINKFNK